MTDKTLKTVVLVGNPNVGKSSLFFRLTGTHVITGNFPGTTLSVVRGSLQTTPTRGSQAYEIIDIPGIHSLTEKTNALTAGALFVINQAAIILNVIDATQLKRGLYLHMQLRSLGKPLIVALNLIDEAGYHGITIDQEKLSSLLGCPVIPTVAIAGGGIRPLVYAFAHTAAAQAAAPATPPRPDWHLITNLVGAVQKKVMRRKHLLEYLTTASVHPVRGALLAITVFGSALFIIFSVSGALENGVQTLFDALLGPPLRLLHAALAAHPFTQKTLIGTIGDTSIDFANALGLLTTGLYVPLGQVAPPVIAFYAIMGALEDSGYLPRLAYVADALMHRYALHGIAIIPMLLGAGCNVTGIVATRLLENRRQRMIAATLIAITVPCASQTGFIFALAPRMGLVYTAALILCLGIMWHLLGLAFGRSRVNNYPEMILELPPLRLPRWRPSLRKLTHRVKNFLADAIPITIAGIGVVLALTHTGALLFLAEKGFWWTEGLWGLPTSIAPALCMGIFRKEIALTFLKTLGCLTPAQYFIATLILLLWFPCVSVYAILYKEFGLRPLLFMTLLMASISAVAGILAHMVLTTFIP